MIRRSPEGKFIEPTSALWEWMPALLEQGCANSIFDQIMKRLAEYCVLHAGKNYASAARVYSAAEGWEPSATANAQFGELCHAEAQKWFHKRDILIRALAEIEAIK